MRRAQIIFGVLPLFMIRDARGQCARSYYPVSDAGSISVTASTFPSDPTVVAGFSMWNNSCPGSGTRFPRFNQDPMADIHISVELREWSNNGGCGVFNHQLNGQGQVIGGTVVVFQHIPADPVTGNPQIECSTGYSETIAHELGHVLGLANATDPTCDGNIMGRAHTRTRADGTWEIDPSRSIKSSECFGANKQWLMDPPRGTETTPPEPAPTTRPPGGCWTCASDSPIVINLAGDSWALTDLDHGVHFDLNARGRADLVTWTSADGHLAFLARDLNGNGTIDSGAELFGTATRLHNGDRATNGFEALRELDRNGDGWIDGRDPGWNDLLLWEDRNHNGVAERDELTRIADSPVLAISLDYRWSGRQDRYGNQFRYRASVRFRSGGAKGNGEVYDIYFLRGNE